MPTQAQLDSAILSYDFNGGIVNQFLTGIVPRMSGTVQIPFDNSAPTATEGFQVWSRTISISNSGSLVAVRGNLTVDHSTNGRYIIAALFADSDCVGPSVVYIGTAGRPAPMFFDMTYSPQSAGNVTFSLRVGANGSGTTHVNQSTTNSLGGSMASTYTIMELQQ